jgi:hypothetical protein
MSDPAPTTRDELRAGQTFAVRLLDGRWGACRILRVEIDAPFRSWAALVAACAWWGDASPALHEPGLRLLQRYWLQGFADIPLLFWVEDIPFSDQVIYLGLLPLAPVEAGLGSGARDVSWQSFVFALVGQCNHDAAEWVAPPRSGVEYRARARKAARQYAAQRRKEALATLSRDPFPPREDGSESEEDAPIYRRILSETLASLLELGDDGDEVARLDLLRRCIERLNIYQDQIDTIVREVLCEAFEALVWIAELEDYGEQLLDASCWREF